MVLTSVNPDHAHPDAAPAHFQIKNFFIGFDLFCQNEIIQPYRIGIRETKKAKAEYPIL